MTDNDLIPPPPLILPEDQIPQAPQKDNCLPDTLDPLSLAPLDVRPIYISGLGGVRKVEDGYTPSGSPPPGSTTTTTPPAALSAPSNAQSAAGLRRQPFNFQSLVASNGPVTNKPNQRRGHRYKHSSVSHNIFLEPPVRPPLILPASLPIPTFAECLNSISLEQRSRILWCICHVCVSGYTLWSAQGSLALTALSHIILFDALGASVCVSVDILGNFEVRKRSTIRHPFGLERVEVLAGFAMSVFLLFMGLDIISHTAEHLLENLQAHPEENIGSAAPGLPHDHHMEHAHVGPGSIDLAALLAVISTLISAVLLKNHGRIGKAMRFNTPLSSLPMPVILSNPSYFLTLSCSAILLLLPLLNIAIYSTLDRLLALTMSLAMILLGIRLAKILGSMLLLSYYTKPANKGDNLIFDLVSEISHDHVIKSVEEAKFLQVHHGLCMANFKLSLHSSGEEFRVRERIAKLVRDRLGGGYIYGYESGGEGQKWEVSVAIL